MKVVPIIHCFDHNYVLPAGVAFQSLLEKAKTPDVIYALHVIGSDISEEDKCLLNGIVARFANATIDYCVPPELELPEYRARGNFTKDMFYKLLIPDLFPQYDRVLVSDVDVVYAGDVAPLYDELAADEEVYVCGTEDVGFSVWRARGILKDSGAPSCFKRYDRNMSQEERSRLFMGVGLFVMNSRLFRRDGMSEKCIEFARNNFDRLVLPEQDVINIVCHPKVKLVSSRYMAIAGYEPNYRRLTDAERAANPAWDEMFANPVQIHYASGIKPWKYPQCPCSKLWFEALLASGLFDRWREWYDSFMLPYMRMATGKTFLDFTIPLHKGKRLHLRVHKERF